MGSAMASGASVRGLSLVMITISARAAAASPIGVRFVASRSPPHPKTQMMRGGITREPPASSSGRETLRTASSTRASASGVCA